MCRSYKEREHRLIVLPERHPEPISCIRFGMVCCTIQEFVLLGVGDAWVLIAKE